MTISTYIEITHTYSGYNAANATINVRISPIIKYVKSISYIDGYSISGMAIKK